MSEFLVLDIEEFTEKAACGADLADFVGGVPAFGAHEVKFFAHFLVSLLFWYLYLSLIIFSLFIFILVFILLEPHWKLPVNQG